MLEEVPSLKQQVPALYPDDRNMEYAIWVARIRDYVTNRPTHDAPSGCQPLIRSVQVLGGIA
ncbi:hypothetical protein LMG28727_07539 [Paraburkholderia kirstenboschensis]|nr:hypothetical protein LMG28727_07539 [Paraburkholderia kirstenboschensis]